MIGAEYEILERYLPVLAFVAGILLAVIATAIDLLRRKRRAAGKERRERQEFLEDAVRTFQMAENICKSHITSATLLDDAGNAFAAREEKGVRKTWKSIDDAQEIRRDCDTTHTKLELIAREIAQGTITTAQLGTTDFTFGDVLEYYRDNFPII